MTLYVGEAVTVKAVATDPIRNVPITDATAEVEFYAPPKNPKANPEDRTRDGDTVTLTYDVDAGCYLGYADTTGWEPGKWAFKVTLSGSYDSWEYGSFTLKP